MEIGMGDIAFEIKKSRGGAEKTDIKRLTVSRKGAKKVKKIEK
jgi:hypothetical protein